MDKRLFGTDGIRSIAGEGALTAMGVSRLGRAIGIWLGERRPPRKQVLLGMDTRFSGPMITNALSRGMISQGIRAVNAGVMPTPAVAHLTREFEFDLGIAISASHNPWQYNGIKCFDEDGFKLSDELEDELERTLNSCEGDAAGGSAMDFRGSVIARDYQRAYLDFLLAIAGGLKLEGLRLVVDCANGAVSSVAKRLFEKLGAALFLASSSPNGTNINDNCGSIYPQSLRNSVLSCGADFGLTLDGDGDRLIACDELGNILDGDCIMAALALDMMKDGKLIKNTLVTTDMSNAALEAAICNCSGRVLRTQVGDKYVLRTLRHEGLNFGGEQSGHLIFLEHSTTGDGLISAIELLKFVMKRGKPASFGFGWFKKFPQILINVEVDKKRPFEEIDGLSSTILECRERLGKSGRVSVRYSGTEPLVRIMVEGPSEELASEIAYTIAPCFGGAQR